MLESRFSEDMQVNTIPYFVTAFFRTAILLNLDKFLGLDNFLIQYLKLVQQSE